MRFEHFFFLVTILCVALLFALNALFTYRLMKHNQAFYQKHKERLKEMWFLGIPPFFSKKELSELDQTTKFIWTTCRQMCFLFFIALFVCMLYQTRHS